MMTDKKVKALTMAIGLAVLSGMGNSVSMAAAKNPTIEEQIAEQEKSGWRKTKRTESSI